MQAYQTGVSIVCHLVKCLVQAKKVAPVIVDDIRTYWLLRSVGRNPRGDFTDAEPTQDQIMANNEKAVKTTKITNQFQGRGFSILTGLSEFIVDHGAERKGEQTVK